MAKTLLKHGEEPVKASSNTKTTLVIGLLVITCLALLIAVIVLSVNRSDNVIETKDDNVCTPSLPSRNVRATSSSSDLFRDLSEDEINGVRDYVFSDSSLNVTDFSKATVTGFSNYIFLIELMNPDKDEALAYLDGHSKKKPTRTARVVIFSGGRTPPIIEEILVPVQNPTSHAVFTYDRKNPIPFSNRPWDLRIMNGIQSMVDQFTQTIRSIMLEDFQLNCTVTCAVYFPALPWVRLFRPVQGLTTFPLPIELMINYEGYDVSTWKIGKIFYNNAVFDTIENFTMAYKSGKISKVTQAAPKGRGMYSNLDRRGSIKGASRKVEPTMYEPGGKRYSAEDNHVEYMGWSFDFRVRTSSGAQLFDIRFNGTRIVYELSLQEAAAFYGGFAPASLFTDYLDSIWSLGRTFELVKGIDCPDTATFFDVVAFVDSGKITKRKNAVCVFELNTGIPLHRHFDYAGDGEYVSYGGMVNTALVFRTIMTPYNYDYIFDYIFYQNGVIEVKATSMGYIITGYWSAEEERFSTRVEKDVAGPIHDHLFNYKVDFDIAGRENSFELIRSKVNKTSRWSPKGGYHYAKYLEREHKKTEKEAAYTYNFQTPSYLNFYNEKAKNSNGVRRGYRVQLNGIIKQLYPANWSYTNAIKWIHHQLAVTKYKKNETRSSTIYNQMDFHDPMIDFSEFINDNDDISRQDLVTWVTIGMMHLPHAEDIPITSTPGTSAGFFLRPFNYFDEDPSIASRDSVVIKPDGKGSKVERSERDARSSCVPRDDPISFFGNLEVL